MRTSLKAQHLTTATSTGYARRDFANEKIFEGVFSPSSSSREYSARTCLRISERPGRLRPCPVGSSGWLRSERHSAPRCVLTRSQSMGTFEAVENVLQPADTAESVIAQATNDSFVPYLLAIFPSP